ncbi:hypothetical protein L1277_002192 [Okibacterium sp. HSC-33S16]|uniref:hypothetical protein n=1 Tax=Okibacterium sp. HSC-33S16 TaxID=2910965 RepID=UPI00209CC04D|nr:hypothetical protein [Okibacterium sp. HSC-33S16]MCP2032093.1 hypothetical protein [Okibacterium sp. HSC-33S16]
MPKRLDMNRTITVGVVILAVISLVAAGILVWVKGQSPSVEQSMFAAYQAQQIELDGAATAVGVDNGKFSTLHEDLTALNTAAAAALVAVTGFSDEPARLLAEAARVEFESSLAAQASAVNESDVEIPDDSLSAESTVEELATGINGLNSAAQLIDEQATAATEALTALRATRSTFVAALAIFGETIPTSATAEIEGNADASASFTDPVTLAVTNLTSALSAGKPGVTELQAYATAAAALRTEQARLDALDSVAPDTDTETAPRTTPRTRTTPSTPSTPPVTTPPAEEAPVAPAVPEETAPTDAPEITP